MLSRRVVPLVLLLAVVAASGYVLLRDPDGGEVGAAAPEPTSDTPAPATRRDAAGRETSRPEHPAASLADRSAGPVSGVAVERTSACAPGAPCAVTTTVRFSPSATAQPVTWRVGTAPWCGRRMTWSAPVTVTAQPGWTSVYATTSVPLPRDPSVALVALTSAPARAQSAPVPAAGTSLSCTPGDAQR